MSTAETNEMNDIWREENKRLEEQLKVNETLLRKLTVSNAATRYEKLLMVSIWGRNLALVYCLIAIVYAMRTFATPVYSIPPMFGALAMFCSFVSHWKLKRPNFEHLSVVELQKSICAFRIHTEKMKVWDIAAVAFWLITLAPAWLKRSYNLSLYDNPRTITIFFSLSVLLMAIIYLSGVAMYAAINQKLQRSEQILANIKLFENNE